MVTPKTVVAEQLKTSAYLLDSYTKDLSDAEYFRPAIPGSNHAAWILGHIATSEDWGRWLLTGAPKQFDDATHALYKGGSVCVPEASKYPARKALDKMFIDARARLVEALEAFDVARWTEPTPEHGPRKQFPTLGTLWGLMGFHAFWHIGHLTTCRVALNKKGIMS